MLFPKDFLWGTAVSAHQTEGNNTNSDWWEWEQSKDYSTGKNKITGKEMKWPVEPSDPACDSYNRYEEDFDLCKKLNNNAVRISIEWARLEPKKGEFSDEAFAHYKKVLESAKARELKTFVTLHHFTNPIWFAKLGGWENSKSSEYFSVYALECVKRLGDLMDVVMTINEPLVLANQAYFKGEWCPAKKNLFLAIKVAINLVKAHRKGFLAIKNLSPKTPVGIVHNYVYYEVKSSKLFFWDAVFAKLLDFINNQILLIAVEKHTDFLGINYYFTGRIKSFKSKNPNDWISDLNWWIYPLGLKELLLRLKKYNFPIYITENGLADENDKHREKFIKEMVKSCEDAINEGVDLRGYFYWSLLDNYEWHHGFWPKFGLVEIDRGNNLQRNPRKSFEYYAQVSKSN